MEARIVEVKQNTSIKVHYAGYKKIYDETIQIPSALIAPLGFHTNTHGIGTILRYDP